MPKILALSKDQTFLFIIYLVPITLLIWFVANFSVNVPYWDQWALVSFFEKVSTHEAHFGDVFAQFFEHRIVFPRIIITALAFISHWNIKYELLANIFLAIITFCAMYGISYNQTEVKNHKLAHLANIVTCILLFSLVQYENWLWGFQIAWFLVNACVTLAVFILAHNSLSTTTKLVSAAIFCFIASFSVAHGLLSWLAVIPSVVLIAGRKQRVRTLMLWGILFLASCAIYSVSYVKTQRSDVFFFLKHPLITLEYFFSVLGSPLCLSPKFGLRITIIIGFIIFSSFLIFTTYFIKTRNSTFKSKATPWISLGLFAILFALMTTIGRANLGVEQAFASRYTTTSVLLIICLVQMGYLFICCNPQKRLFDNVYKLPLNYKLLAGILTCFVLINSVAVVFVYAPKVQLERQNNKTCLEIIHYLTDESLNNCLQRSSQHISEVREGAQIIDKLGFRDFPRDISFISKPAKYGYMDTLTISRSFINTPESVSAAGAVILPKKLDFPKMVLLSYDNKKFFFTSTPVNLDSQGFATLSFSRYIKLKWAVKFSTKFLPVGQTVIKAWVYDPYEKQFVKLAGELKVKAVPEP